MCRLVPVRPALRGTQSCVARGEEVRTPRSSSEKSSHLHNPDAGRGVGEQGRRSCIHNSTRRKGRPRAGEKASLTHDARPFYSPEAFSSQRQN